MVGDSVFHESIGEFWLANNPQRRARGVLTCKRDENAVVSLESSLRDSPKLETVHEMPGGGIRIDYRAHTPEESVSSFQPVTMHGRLDDGTLITGLYSQNHKGDGEMGIMPEYHLRFLLWGIHAQNDTAYTAARFQFHGSGLLPRVWAEPTAVQTISHKRLEGTLTPLIAEETRWLAYRSHLPVQLRTATDEVANACRLFIDTVLDRDTRFSDVQVESDGAWIQVISPSMWQSPQSINPITLMPPETITIERLGIFVDLHNSLDALTDPIAHPVDHGAIQARLLVNAAIVEGVHRRLWLKRRRFSLPPNTSIRSVRKAAKEAGVKSLVVQGITDQATAEKSLTDALQYLDDISFAERVKDIVNEVQIAIPELFESIPDYAGKLVRARNELAHFLVADEAEGETLSQKIDRWAALDFATPWVLRALLMLRAGVTPQEIAHSFRGDDALHDPLERRLPGYQRFQISLENIRQIARELGWSE